MFEVSFVAVNASARMPCLVDPDRPWRACVGRFEFVVTDGILGFLVMVVDHGVTPARIATVILPWLVEQTTIQIPETALFVTLSRLRIRNADPLPERDGTNGLSVLITGSWGTNPVAVGIGLHETVNPVDLCGAVSKAIEEGGLQPQELSDLRRQLYLCQEERA